MMISTGVGTSNGAIASAALSLPYHESLRWLPPLALRSSSLSSTSKKYHCIGALRCGGGDPVPRRRCRRSLAALRVREPCQGATIALREGDLYRSQTPTAGVLLRSLLFASRAPPIPLKAVCYESSDLGKSQSSSARSPDQLQSTNTTALPAFFTDTGPPWSEPVPTTTTGVFHHCYPPVKHRQGILLCGSGHGVLCSHLIPCSLPRSHVSPWPSCGHGR